MKLRLGTRGSALAKARAEQVAELMGQAGVDVETVVISEDVADGSQLERSTLATFAKVQGEALRANRCDFVVHPCKDIPFSSRPRDLVRPAVLEREDHRDVLCTRTGATLSALPRGSRVGANSLRRIAQLRALRPDLTFIDAGGTLRHRLSRLQPGDMDALVLSAASVHTLGLEDRVAEYLGLIPAPGQGALVLECRADDEAVIEALRPFDDIETRICVEAERAVLTGLETDYFAPVGAIAKRRGILSLKAGAFSIDGTKRVVLEVGLPTSEFHAERTGHNVALALKQRRAERFFSEEAIASVKLSAEHDDESPFIKSPEDDDRIRVLLPRQEGRLAQSLRANQLRVDCTPLQEAKLISADNLLGWADWVVLPSAQAVWALRERGWDIPENKKIAAMGSTTRQVLEEGGQKVDLSPDGTASSARVVEMFPPAEGEVRVVIACADELSTKLEDGLRAKGYTVERLEVYTMEPVANPNPKLLEMWARGVWDAILLSHPSLAQVYVDMLGHRDDVAVLAWDAETAAALNALGVPVWATAKQKDNYGSAFLARELERRRAER